MKNVLKPRVKNVLIPFGLTAAESATKCSFSKESLWTWYDKNNNF